MKYMAALVLLALSVTAQAEHHRGHALAFLDEVDVHNGQLQKHLDSYESVCKLSGEDKLSLDVLFRYSGALFDSVSRARDILVDRSGDLDLARRELSRPNSEAPNAANVLVSGLMHRARLLVGVCRKGDKYLPAIIQRITLAWVEIDHATWHVNDAIREEIYGDPEFICSGPNNHCGE